MKLKPRTPRSLLPAVLTTLTALALLVAPTGAAHANGPAGDSGEASPVSLSWDDGGGSGTITDPVLASLHRRITFHVDVFNRSDAALDDVEVTAQGDGLQVWPAARTVDHLDRTGLATVVFEVEATTPGMHRLTVTATPEGQPSDTLDFAHVWAPGQGAHLSPRDGLAQLGGFAWQGPLRSGESSPRVTRQVAIVNRFWAYLGTTVHGVPECHHAGRPWSATSGCVRYAYDHRDGTGIVQIGGLIGRFADVDHPRGGYTYLTGFVPADPTAVDEAPYATLGFSPDDQLSFPRKGAHVGGEFVYRNRRPHAPAGTTGVRLRLTRAGHYRLAVTTRNDDGATRTRTSAGSYRLAGRGDLVLRHRGSPAEHHALAFNRNANGRLRAYLTLRTDQGPDAVFAVRR